MIDEKAENCCFDGYPGVCGSHVPVYEYQNMKFLVPSSCFLPTSPLVLQVFEMAIKS